MTTTARDAALAIADRIRARAIDENGLLYWTTVTMDGSEVVMRVDESLYSGVAGIALLFLELGDLDTAGRALRWVELQCDANEPQHYGYYTGRLGVVDVFVRAFEITGQRRWLDTALRIAYRGTGHEERLRVADLLSGYAGSIIALLRLHAHAPEEWIVQWIDRLLARLLDESHLDAGGGIYWDRSVRQIRGLCGLSHGAAGCGMALLEAGRYFDDPALIGAGELAFAYERHAFERHGDDWPDYRIDVDTPEGRARAFAALGAGDREFFTVPRSMNAWCHGAIGIGLARLRACEIAGETYRDDVKTAIGKTRGFRFGDFLTLCHGSAAAMLFLHSAGDDDAAGAFADPILDAVSSGDVLRSGYRPYEGEDVSLMMGSAGIAYALLMLERKGDTILLPVSRADPFQVRGEYAVIGRGENEVARRILATTYPRTIAKLGKPALRFNSLRGSLDLATRAVPAVKADYDIERAKDLFEQSIDSSARLGLLESLRRASARDLLAGPIDDVRLRVVPEAVAGDGRLLIAGSHGAREVELATLAAWLVERFGEGARAGEVIDEVAADYAEEVEDVRKAVAGQIRELIAAGILIAD